MDHSPIHIDLRKRRNHGSAEKAIARTYSHIADKRGRVVFPYAEEVIHVSFNADDCLYREPHFVGKVHVTTDTRPLAPESRTTACALAFVSLRPGLASHLTGKQCHPQCHPEPASAGSLPYGFHPSP